MTTNEDGRTTRQKVGEMMALGYTPRQIANALDLSTQRVYAIKKVLAAIDADKAEQEASA